MKSRSDDLLRGPAPEPVRAKPTKWPKGIEPGVVWDGKKGTAAAVLPVSAGEPVWDELLSRANLDPAAVEVVPGSVNVRTWDAAIGDGQVVTMRYFKADVRTKRENAPDIEELLALVSRSRPARERRDVGGAAFVVPQSDWQLGKRGTGQIVDRICDSIDRAVARYRFLRKRPGLSLGSIVIPFLGDLGESCDGHYAMQTFEVELDYREQRRLGRRLAWYAIDRLAPLAERVVVPVVPGNHGEMRKGGRAFTSFGDNQDIEIVEGVAEAMAQNPSAYGHVTFVIPDDELTLTLEVGGLITGFAHGHQAKKGPTAQSKVAAWWSGQAMGQRPVGDARILYTGHYHHLSVVEHGPRIHVQCPTMDTGSAWWDETAGLPSRAGLLTVVQASDGLHDLEVL